MEIRKIELVKKHEENLLKVKAALARGEKPSKDLWPDGKEAR